MMRRGGGGLSGNLLNCSSFSSVENRKANARAFGVNYKPISLFFIMRPNNSVKNTFFGSNFLAKYASKCRGQV